MSTLSRKHPGQFAHLHLHTEYSLLDGGNQVEKLVARLAELGMSSCAITDHGNIFGAVAFYQACKDKGIHPILGVEAYVTPPGKPRTDRTYSGGGEGGYHLVLLAENDEGWRNLLVLCSEAFLTGFYYKPRIDRELLAKHNRGLIAINGHLGSEIGDHLLDFHRSQDQKFWDAAVESARWHASVFTDDGTGPRAFIEMQHHVPEQNAINPLLVKLARQEGMPLVCDNDAHFLRAEDHDAHDTLICISTARGKNDDNRMRYPRELYVKSPREMEDLFEAYGEVGAEALDNSVAIAARCRVNLPLGANNAPAVQIDLPDPSALPAHDDPRFGGDLSAWYTTYCAAFELKPFREPPTAAQIEASKANCDRALRMLAEAGYVWRYGAGGSGAEADRRARLERELRVLADKNISAYFLIVWDFVNWGRQRGIPANARGSGVGTMVGYVLGLSNACPVKYGLLFERFTDPDRSEYPDIDIDLCQDGRGDVINYVREKYGHVAQIITFGTLGAKAAIRDVGRVLEVPLGEVDRLCKLIPAQLNISIQEAIDQEAELKKLYNTEPRYRQLLDNAIQLEGHTRHAGVHAAGVIVATRPLQEIIPLYRPPGTDGNEIITQWDGPTCEKMGLLKMDFLGLRTLSVIERAKKLIRQGLSEDDIYAAVGRSRGDGGPHPLDLDRLEYDDQNVLELFRRGETTGVFQFESGGMRRLLVEMKPDRLEDLIAANALFRPGPMELIPDYNRRKHRLDVVPTLHPIVDTFTSETYGVMVYQEQIMQIVHGLGGIKLRDAYSLIKNISKKKHDKIEKERPKFVQGAQQQGLSAADAQALFELILKFAGYGFNKSHSTGYAIVAYHTAYLKTYFPRQYMAAFLTYESQAGKASEWIPYLDDCRRTRSIDPRSGETVGVGVEVRPPEINLSEADFAVVYADEQATLRSHQGHLRFGLKAIKGLGEKAVGAIIAERERAGPYTSLFDLTERLPTGVLNKTGLESLIKCGALDGCHGRALRAAMTATIDQALTAGSKAAADKAAGQGGLFGGGAGPASAKPAAGTLARAEPWSEAETLKQEKDTVGFYISSHPLERWRAWGNAFSTTSVAGVKDLPQDTRVVVAAMIQSVRTILVRNGRSAGQKMAIVTIEDLSGSCDSVIFSDNYTKFGHLAVAEQVVFVLGRVDRARGEPQVLIERLVPIDGVPLDGGKLRLFVDETRLNGGAGAAIERVARALQAPPPQAQRAPGEMPPAFSVELFIGTDSQVAVLSADPKLRVQLAPDLVQAIEAELGHGMVRATGIAIDKAEKDKKPWQRRRSGGDDE
ncbi:MAG: DNA polymerase III subunit alpha [Leptolyngbya sp. PLA1]|nr:DNA polymerase III subunit alpha [Leptolyngbya sp. PLA1]